MKSMLKLHHYHCLSLLKNLESVTNQTQFFQKNFCTFLVKNVFQKQKLNLKNTCAFIYVGVKQNKKDEDRDVIIYNEFENATNKDKNTFYDLVKHFDKNYNVKTCQASFIQEALKHMKEFGVHKDIKAYKKLLNLFPRKIYVVRNKFQLAFMKFPKQQFAAIELLDKMEHNGVLPDVELGAMLIEIFGRQAIPTVKYYKMLYWSLKFKSKSPWLLPKQVPSDPFLLGQMAVERITSNDLETKISIYNTEEIAESIDKTWIVSAQSKQQKELLESHLPAAPVIVEGGDVIWLRDKFIKYFVLKADCQPKDYNPPEDPDDLSKMQTMYFNPDYKFDENELISRHEQDDGIIYAVCVTGTSSKDSLLSWIRLLQKKENPLLEKVPILFRFKNSSTFPVPFSDELKGFEEKI